MLIRVLSNAICSVLTTFPVFCICYVFLHLVHAVTWPIKCVIIYLSPLSLKIIVCPLFKAQRTQYEPPVTVPTICGLCFAWCLQHKNISCVASVMETQRIGVRLVETAVSKGGEHRHPQSKDFLIFVSDIYHYKAFVGRMFLKINYTVVFRALIPCTCVVVTSTFRRKMLFLS